MSNEIISQELVNKYLKKKVPWGFSGLGYVTYKRTYAREKENGEMEEWPETIARCINGAQKIGAEYTPEEAKRLFDHVFNLRCNSVDLANFSSERYELYFSAVFLSVSREFR